MKTNFCQSRTKQIKYTPQYWLLAARPTSECEVEGEALLAEAGVAVLHDAEVGVVRVLVVHGGDVQLPAHHHQLQVCTAQRAQEDLTITEKALSVTHLWPRFWSGTRSCYQTSRTQFELDASLSWEFGT